MLKFSPSPRPLPLSYLPLLPQRFPLPDIFHFFLVSDVFLYVLGYLSYMFSSFLLCRLRLFVTLILYFLSWWFCLSCPVYSVNCCDFLCVCVYLPILQFSLVALSYQLTFNTSSRSYAVYELTISTTYQYSGYNYS